MRPESSSMFDRYSRRTRTYSPVDPAVYMARQEVERTIVKWIRLIGTDRCRNLSLLEIGCGSGGNLLQFLRMGFQPEQLTGNELQPKLSEQARKILPEKVAVIDGDALDLELEPESFDVIFQSLVFSSILDDEFQVALAQKLWRSIRPQGGVLWYDFTYNNPQNPDVRGVPRKRISLLFPAKQIVSWRITLAPPISRLVTRIHPSMYTLFNCLRPLRTHLLCWIEKQ